jgi:3',5'-cyclic AMP phosphodiesterase CpdA
MSLTFVHISDLHFGQEDAPALELAAHTIAQVRPDAVIASGDLTALGSNREMRAAFDWLRALRAPVLTTPGNHDTPYFDLMPRLIDPFGHFRRESEGVHIEAWTHERFTIIPINTARGVQWRKNWALGAISHGQVHRACDGLNQAPSGNVKIVVTHHPLVWPSAAPIPGETRGGAEALHDLITAGADLFLSGHLHQASVERFESGGRSALMLSAGTLSIRYRGEPASFSVIRRDDDGVWSFECISLKASRPLEIAQRAVARMPIPA